MSGTVKFWLTVAVVLVVCYALNINPFTLIGDLVHGLQQAHHASVTGR